MVPVVSSDIASVSYDAASELLHIKFHTGRVYAYHNVPKRIYKGLMSAGSKGKYYNAYI